MGRSSLKLQCSRSRRAGRPLRYSLCSSCSRGAQPTVGEASPHSPLVDGGNDSGSQLMPGFLTSNRPVEYSVTVGISRLLPFLHPHHVEMQENAVSRSRPALARFREYAGSGCFGGREKSPDNLAGPPSRPAKWDFFTSPPNRVPAPKCVSASPLSDRAWGDETPPLSPYTARSSGGKRGPNGAPGANGSGS